LFSDLTALLKLGKENHYSHKNALFADLSGNALKNSFKEPAKIFG